MKIDIKNKRKVITILTIILIVLFLVYLFIMTYNYLLVKNYKNKMYPNVYINSYNISNISLDKLREKVNKIEDEFKSKKIVFLAGKNEYNYTYNDLGLTLDKDKLIKEIIDYHDNIPMSKKVKQIVGDKKKIFTYKVTYNEENVTMFVTNLKQVVDNPGSEAKLTMGADRNLVYEDAISSFNLNTEETTTKLIKYIDNGVSDESFELIGEINEFNESRKLKEIDTKVSTYSTRYNAYISRGRNLEAALRYLDGTIVNSGEVFSYFNVAGPYSKKGYVYYDDVLGNGVCQIASTIYNTTLLGGLEVVSRYQHQKYMSYVPGGRDATVVSNNNQNSLDYKFKNTYKYPIYISAYYGGGVATVEFWSNSNAKEGKEYEVTATSLGNSTYQTYLHTYQNGQEISVTPIARSHYTG